MTKKWGNSRGIVLSKATRKHNKDNFFYRFFKRMFDIIFGLVGIILLIPLTILLFFVRKHNHDDNMPMFYAQLRFGKNGKVFKLYKYRSMCLNADEILEDYLNSNPEAKKEYKKYKKLKNDPRVTKSGEFIRKSSMDEMPQFINILKGEMTVVGPRPYLPREKEDMGKNFDTIVSVKPGLTGLWQVSGRSNASFEERMKLDKKYIRERSVWLDIKIFFKTIGKTFFKDSSAF